MCQLGGVEVEPVVLDTSSVSVVVRSVERGNGHLYITVVVKTTGRRYQVVETDIPFNRMDDLTSTIPIWLPGDEAELAIKVTQGRSEQKMYNLKLRRPK